MKPVVGDWAGLQRFADVLRAKVGGSAAPATAGISAAVAGLICGAEIIAFWNTIEKIRSAFNDAKKVMTAVEAVQKDFGNLQVSLRMPNLPSLSGDTSALSVLPS